MSSETSNTAALPRDERGENVLTFALLLTATRCILQYAVLPFVLPILGVAGAFSVPITMLFTLVSLGSITYSIRRMFRINYRHKWTYAIVAGTAFIISVSFLVMDIIALTV